MSSLAFSVGDGARCARRYLDGAGLVCARAPFCGCGPFNFLDGEPLPNGGFDAGNESRAFGLLREGGCIGARVTGTGRCREDLN